MPTYTYHCKKCNSATDHFHGISATPRIKCEECGSVCKRMIGTGSGIIFKGTGFYETDYKTKSGKPEPKKDSSKKSGDTKKPAKAKATSSK